MATLAREKQKLINQVRKNLTYLREQAGISQRELARRMGLSGPGWINDIERGRRPGMNVGSIAPICKALGVNPAMLFIPFTLRVMFHNELTTERYRKECQTKRDLGYEKTAKENR